MTASFDFVAPHMRSLQQLEHSLTRLDVRWEVIETTARIVCPREAASFLPTLMSTRSSFSELASELVERIAAAHLNNRLRDLSSRAQVAIDILIRNLFERTADVGFIATDSPLVDFVQHPDESTARAIRERLAEYRAKYTVYSDIVVLSNDARVLVRLADSDATWTQAPDWWTGMMAKDGYVERFGRCGLFADGNTEDDSAHYYAHRICSKDGRSVGAVLLRFDFASEVASVFEDLLSGDRDTLIVFADDDNRVIATSRPNDIALGARLGTIDEFNVLASGGHDWLAQARWTRGYQGYRGLPWQAFAMIRVDAAFRVRKAASLSIDGQLQDDDERLREIVDQASRVEEGLHRVVWNGKLARPDDTGASSVHAVFDQIAGAGRQTTALFSDAIGALKALLRDGRCAELAFHASLAVRIMDRNLYERANDCRWWALSPDLSAPLEALAANPGDIEAKQTAESVLAHLNSLYTVYRRVALFDCSGRVVAVSRDADSLAPDLHIDTAIVQRVLALSGTAAYVVSDFVASDLTDGHPTYLYCAAVRGSGGQIIGGVALAFNSHAEFLAMLKDALPDGAPLKAMLVDQRGTVISSTDDAVVAGSRAACAVTQGSKELSAWAQVIDCEGQRLLAGAARSQGYREFKRGDGYVEPIRAVIFNHLPVEANAATVTATQPGSTSHQGERRIAVVACGSLMFGFDAQDVVEAVSAQRMVGIAGSEIGAGLLEYASGSQKNFVAAIDMNAMCGEKRSQDPRGCVAVIVRQRETSVALLVDRLVYVIERGDVMPPPQVVSTHSRWINGVISVDEASNEMIYMVDPRCIDTSYKTADGSTWP